MTAVRRVLVNRAWLFALAYALFAYTFHSVGNATGLYVRYWWFQLLTHYISASAVALLVARVGLGIGLRGTRLAAFVVAFAGAGAVGWEVVEYLGLFANLHFWGFDDSAVDLLADAVGIATVLLLLRTRVRPALDPGDETTFRGLREPQN
ncbi:MAG: hypothetical protein ABEJ22_08775 [Haloferacaceae archaeon]